MQEDSQNWEESTGFSLPPASIVNQIQTLLKERYKQGFPIIKEIIQNANDGGATQLGIGITQGLKNATHPLLKGSGLFFINNGNFCDSDAQAIGWFGADMNVGNAAKIGKFGLGQKSIFHFCEAFFYVAHSHHLSGEPDRGRFLNPWADSTNLTLPDSKHPDWKQLTLDDRNRVVEYLRGTGLLDDEFFLLWLPLRSNAISDRCILPNYYDHQSIQEHLSKNLSSRIATLMPMLRSLQSVHYWLPDENNCLIEDFQVQLDSSARRYIYPKADGEIGEPMNRLLYGRVDIDNHKTVYGGKEVLLDVAQFNQLRDSAYWPKRFTQDEFGRPISVKDKAIPHCGVIFSRSPAQDVGSLTVQWAVFLPLVDDKSSGNTEFEQIPSKQDWNYTLLLHGYFFLDSGRRSIEALADIYSSSIEQVVVPANDTQMMQLWNTTLAKEGTLPQVLLALEEFCKQYIPGHQEIEEICYLLRQTEIFQNKNLQQCIYQDYCWVYRLQHAQSSWQLIDCKTPILTLPSVPDWNAFPALGQIAETKQIVLEPAPNLIPQDAFDLWQDLDIVEVLNSLHIHKVFHQVSQFEFLVKWLQSTSQSSEKSLSGAVQDCLQKQLKTFLIESETETATLVQTWLKAAILLLDEARWFCLDSDNLKLLQLFNQTPIKILILPSHLAPLRQNSSKLPAHDAATLIERHYSSLNQPLILQIVGAVTTEESTILYNLVNKIRFISGFNCQINQSSLYTLEEIRQLSQQGQLFLNSESSRNFARDLQRALHERPIVLIDDLFAKRFCLEIVQECNRDACLMTLTQKPRLADCSNRINLLERLLP